MRSIGFIVSDKDNEKRRAIVPNHLKDIKHKDYVFIEKGYGDVLGFKDEDYSKLGCKVVTREEIKNCDIICDPKIGDGGYLSDLQSKIVFGWVHATQNKDITNILINRKLTAYAWEKMYEGNRHTFWRNNEIAGEAAIMHAFQLYGKMPYDCNVAIVGKGNTSRGALKILTLLGANVVVYDRKTEDLFRKEFINFDVIVNTVLWDINRTDHLIYYSDLERMKNNSLIIDISCDKNGGIETSIPTSFNNPTYVVNGVMHYVVDHTPTLFFKTVSKDISKEVCKYVDDLVENNCNQILRNSLIIDKGVVVDSEINSFQNR